MVRDVAGEGCAPYAGLGVGGKDGGKPEPSHALLRSIRGADVSWHVRGQGSNGNRALG